MKTLECREHGGTFEVPVKRGRPPVKCNEENPCTAVRKAARRVGKSRSTAPKVAAEITRASRGMSAKRPPQAVSKPERPVRDSGRPGPRTRALQAQRSSATDVKNTVQKPRSRPETNGAVVTHNPSVPLAYDAKKILEPQGWNLTGRKWSDDEGHWANVIGQRGDETITLQWCNGKLVDQTYQMFSTDRPSANGMPRPRLDFDVDELSDVALVRRLSGKTVKWWSALAKSIQTVVMPHESKARVKVEHLMTGRGDEERRLVSFVDASDKSTGFRAFDVHSLLSVK